MHLAEQHQTGAESPCGQLIQDPVYILLIPYACLTHSPLLLLLRLLHTHTGAFDDPNGSHIAITVVSPLFRSKRPVQRQQMVYKAIWEELQGPVHAVDSMVCQTPEEAGTTE